MSAVEAELNWRMNQWHMLQQSPNWPMVTAQEIRDLNLYNGAAGIYRDKSRTSTVAPDGVAVSIMNSSGNYSDEIEGDLMIYDYPSTNRAPAQDLGEIASLKNAMAHQIPLFVITELDGNRRSVNLGWITQAEDTAKACLVTLNQQPQMVLNPLADLALPFEAKVKRALNEAQIKRIERDPGFKFKALTLYKSTCAVTDVKVEKMLDAAHVIPVANYGPDDVRNSLLLNSAVHRAFDAHYWSIHPETLKLATRTNGPTLSQMKIVRTSIQHLDSAPHQEALEFRWKQFEKSTGGHWQISA